MADFPFLANNTGPPWLPASVAEARKFAFWGQLIYLVFFFIWLVFGVIMLFFSSWSFGAYLLTSAAVNIIIVFLLNTTVFESIDQGRFNEASDRLLIWGILGIIFGIIPGIFMIIAFLRIQDVFQPQYQPYPPQQPGQYQQPPQYQQPSQTQPQQYQQPPAPARPQQEPPRAQVPQQPQPATPQQTQQAQKPKHEMVKCKKCGVQYPAFMRTCPNCGEPR
ncbi:MAG: zinc ribbon domain-containing protein [Methanomassiliicoccales archaeon]|nr:zinc ribbon domain-containing protein [Methanomassiliicoccales archaeon]NYT15536.1 zinc ribbon domain-containing protein [Methanomassiliicoccales archaeon]